MCAGIPAGGFTLPSNITSPDPPARNPGAGFSTLPGLRGGALMRGFRGQTAPGERGRNHVKKRSGSTEGRGHDKVEGGRRGKEAWKAVAGGTAYAGNDKGPFRWVWAAAKRLQLLPEDAEALQGGLRFAERYWNGRFAFANLVFRPASGHALPRPCAGRPTHFARVNEADVRRDPVRPGADGGSRRLFFRFAKCWFASRMSYVRSAKCWFALRIIF